MSEAAPSKPAPKRYVEGEVIVKFRAGTPASRMAATARAGHRDAVIRRPAVDPLAGGARFPPRPVPVPEDHLGRDHDRAPAPPARGRARGAELHRLRRPARPAPAHRPAQRGEPARGSGPERDRRRPAPCRPPISGPWPPPTRTTPTPSMPSSPGAGSSSAPTWCGPTRSRPRWR